MIPRNKHLTKLKTSYLFPEIHQRKQQFLLQHPEAQIISLGIGDTTEPIPSSITESLVQSAMRLGTPHGYMGYGPEQGIALLRQKIAETFYNGRISPEEIFVSDGAKCDIARLQVLFGNNISIAVQDPAYPVYVDGSLIQGVTSIHMMPCLPENAFFPDLDQLPHVNLIYFCSPNNPTGASSSFSQLEELVHYAQKNRSLILFDAAYSPYIQDPHAPKSIFEIPGAEKVAIEIHSFSKLAGFTGIRLGWTVVPHALKYEDGSPIRQDWNRIHTTLFNGASVISQQGGIAALEKQGLEKLNHTIQFYLENARLIKSSLEGRGYEVFGSINAPYVWVRFPKKTSWEIFQELLEKAHIVATPGSGFGPSGEGFIRFSAFGKREQISLAAERLKQLDL